MKTSASPMSSLLRAFAQVGLVILCLVLLSTDHQAGFFLCLGCAVALVATASDSDETESPALTPSSACLQLQRQAKEILRSPGPGASKETLV